MIVVPLLAMVFNHAGCSDESRFFCTKKRAITFRLPLFFYVLDLNPQFIGVPEKSETFWGEEEHTK